MVQVQLHQLHRMFGIARSQGGHDVGMFFVRMLGRRCRLVHQGDQCAAGNQLAQQLCQHLVAHELGHAHVEVAQQLGALAHVIGFHGLFLGSHMLLEGANLGGAALLDKAAHHFGLKHAAHGKHLACLVHRRRCHKGAAGGLEPDETVLRKLKQGLAHQGAGNSKVVGQLLLGQLGAGHQAMLDDGLGQAFDNETGGGSFHKSIIAVEDKFCIQFLFTKHGVCIDVQAQKAVRKRANPMGARACIIGAAKISSVVTWGPL
ncbi:hypothetical protein SDC9_150415 [bioreactor metagenome]|uniref:Uncharacterized protein n=1 Tax=bioreactor metagenome TaxID=1076179 RepID=A0A645EPW1_9ZZZZ